MAELDLEALLQASDKHVADEVRSQPDVTDVGDDLALGKLPIEARRWHRLDDLVAVNADLKNSTQLDVSKYPASTASIYEAAIRPAANILAAFDADDMDIQGDGIVGVYWGDGRMERAICSAITIKTFSVRHLQERLDNKWPKTPTGFKVGVAASPVLVKRLGIPRTDHQEEVWAGKAVNYAAKAAQSGDRGDLIVTAGVWDRIKTNDYLAFTCGCNGGPKASLWKDANIDKLPDDSPERPGKQLTTQWCVNCGPGFAAAVLDGQRRRDEVGDLRRTERLSARTEADAQRRRDLRELRRRQ